jgi:DNA repair photolyase
MRPLPLQNPLSPWQSTHVEYLGEPPRTALEVLEDDTKEILSKNDSPDVGFRWSVNPYRGCYHGCAYCYARPSHEYLGLGSGTDFERKIVVKRRAPALLRAALSRRGWKKEPIAFSGNTDCYQPLEASYRLTRQCLEICADAANPVHVITKAPLIERDVDILLRLARQGLGGVTVSIPFWNERDARLIEPGVATPERRMLTVERLARAGISVSVNVAPVIPGLTDRDIPRILEAAARAGAASASMILLRLPGNVREVFEARLRAGLPLAADRILARTREVRGGRLNDPAFGSRMSGEGEYAAAIHSLFDTTARRLGLSPRGPATPPPRAGAAPGSATGRAERPGPPAPGARQLSLFGGDG